MASKRSRNNCDFFSCGAKCERVAKFDHEEAEKARLARTATECLFLPNSRTAAIVPPEAAEAKSTASPLLVLTEANRENSGSQRRFTRPQKTCDCSCYRNRNRSLQYKAALRGNAAIPAERELKLSQYPFSHGDPGSMYKIFARSSPAICADHARRTQVRYLNKDAHI